MKKLQLSVQTQQRQKRNLNFQSQWLAKKVITSANIPGHPSAADVLEEPLVVARGTMVTVVTKDAQRYG